MSNQIKKSVETINTDTLVVISNDQPTTTSLKIAEYFGKDHSKILRDIKKLLESGEIADANFGLSSYTDNSGKSNPMYQITKDGFTLLTMGFTGAKALKFKVNYINAFNKMEQTLKSQIQPAPQTTNQFDFFRSMIDNLENQAKEIIQIKSEVQTLKETPKTFNISIEKIADLKGVKKMERDELGRSINNCVGKIGKQFGFKTVATPKTDENGQEMFEYSYYLDNGQKVFGPMFFKLQHHFVRELYKKETGREYEGDKSATTGDKEDYQKWLNRYVARNCSDNLPDLV